MTKEQIVAAIRAMTFDNKEHLQGLKDEGVTFTLPADFRTAEAKFNGARDALAECIEKLTGEGEFDSDEFMAAGQYLIDNDLLGN